jgi:hypothetical protein
MLSAVAGAIIILSIGFPVAHARRTARSHRFKKTTRPRHFFKKEHGRFSFVICRNPNIALASAQFPNCAHTGDS